MDTLFWIYLINAVILINHEINSAYWQEWKLINMNDKFGSKGFLIIHFPLLFLILFGLVLVFEHRFSGYVISLILASSGLFAFFFHFYHLRKGKSEFNTIISKAIILATFLISVIQIYLTIKQLTK